MKPPGQSRQPPNAIEQTLQRAAFALQNRRPQEAEWIAAEALKSNPSEPRLLQMAGYALLIQGKPKDAIAPLEQAARRAHDPAVETQLAIALKQAGRAEEALERLRRAIKRRPPFPPAFFELGQQLSALERYDEAIEVLKGGLALMPQVAELSAQLGYILMNRNDRAGARATFTRAIELAPRHVDALYGLARAMQRDGDYAPAAETYRRLLAIKPDEAAARIGLGACLLELGQQDAAMDSLRQASHIAPQMFGQTLTALSASARGRFWLRVSDAEKAVKGEKK